MPLEPVSRPYEHYTEGPFTCAACGGQILQGEPHNRQAAPRSQDASTIAAELGEAPRGYVRRHFCCHAESCLYAAYLRGKRDRPCDCSHVTNVDWWPCSQCGIAHGGHCPPPDALLPPWPPAGWRHPETGDSAVDRRREVQRRRLDFELRPAAVAGQRRHLARRRNP